MDEGRHAVCCRTSDEEVVAAEGVSCASCVVAAQCGTLDAENAEAWGLYQRVFSRCAMESQSVGARLAAVLAGRDQDDAMDLCARLDAIYALLVPVKSDGA